MIHANKRPKGAVPRDRELTRTCWSALAVLWGLHWTAVVASAQQPANPASDDNGVLQWVIAVAAAGVVLGAAFINPKRSHQT